MIKIVIKVYQSLVIIISTMVDRIDTLTLKLKYLYKNKINNLSY